MAVTNVTPTLIPSAESFSTPLVNELGYQGIYATPISSTEVFSTISATIGVASVTTTAIPSAEAVNTPYMARGELVSITIPSDEYFYNITVSPGAVTTTTTAISSSEQLYYPAISTNVTDQFISISLIPSAEYVESPQVGFSQTSTATLISSSEVIYSPLITGQAVTTSSIATNETFLTTTITPGTATVTATSIPSSEVFSSVSIPTVFGYLDVTPVNSAESFSSLAIVPTVSVTTSIAGSQEHFFIASGTKQHNTPLRVRLPMSMYGGILTNDVAAPLLDYYTLPGGITITQGDFVVTKLQRISPSYIPSTAALFSGTFYSSFYISNDTQVAGSSRKNIYLWINGGESFTVQNGATPLTVFQENTSVLDSLVAAGLTLTSNEYTDFNFNGKNNSTMFGQVVIETLIGPSSKLVEFNPDGSSIGLDLRRQTFQPSTHKLPIPELKQGEYVGVYLKINTIFNPNDRFPVDYAFVHLSSNFYYPVSPSTPSIREVYPGQSQQSDGTRLDQFLPSMTLMFITNYDKMLSAIDDHMDTLYSKYPPYFLYYKDIKL